MSVAGQKINIDTAQVQEAGEIAVAEGKTTVKKAGELITSTITTASKTVGDTIGSIADVTGLDQVSLAPGMTVEDFSGSLANAPQEGLGKTLENITGLNLRGLIGTPSTAKIKNLIKKELGGISSLIALELQKCIENHILALLGKIPEIGIVLNLESIINDAIAKERAKLQNKFTLNLNKLAFQKIKVQQVALFKQKIADAIRNACPEASPRNINKYQADPRKIIEIAKKVAEKTTKEVEEEAEKQAKGFNEDTSENFTESDSKENTTKQALPEEVEKLTSFQKQKRLVLQDLEQLLILYTDFNNDTQYITKGFFDKDRFLYNIKDIKFLSPDAISKDLKYNLIQAEFGYGFKITDKDEPKIVSWSPEAKGSDFPDLTKSQQRMFDKMVAFPAAEIQRKRLEMQQDVDKVMANLKKHVGRFVADEATPMKEGTDLYVDPEIYNINQIKDNATIRKDFVRMISDSFITKIDRTLILYGSTIHLDGRLRNYEA
tara:strand:+ start:583 stop:2055 length:1473 start_codon:yes stop_codon:yes gene_type:complete